MSQTRQIMGTGKFYLLIFISLSFVSSSSPFQKTLSSELMQESEMKEGKGLHAYKVAIGGAGGAHGGSHSPGHGSPHNGGNGGGSKTPTQGGAAVIPAYGAGAVAAHANERRHGRSSGSLHRIELPTLLIITFLYTPLLHLSLFV